MAYYQDKQFLKALGLKIREARKAKKMTQASFALLSGFPTSQIARTERGEINTSICHLKKFAETLELETKDLIP